MVESKNLQTNIEQLLALEDVKRLNIEELKLQEQEAQTRYYQTDTIKQQKERELSQTEAELKEVKSQLKTEKFKRAASEAGSAIMDGISSALGTSKVKRQQQEIESLTMEKHKLKQEITGLNQTVNRERQEKEKMINERNKVHYWLPDTPNLIKWGEYFEKIGFTSNQAKDLINMKPVQFTGELYSNEYSQRFKANDVEVRFDRGAEKSSGFRLLINGISLTQWFRQKYDELREAIGIRPKQKSEMDKSKEIRR